MKWLILLLTFYFLYTALLPAQQIQVIDERREDHGAVSDDVETTRIEQTRGMLNSRVLIRIAYV